MTRAQRIALALHRQKHPAIAPAMYVPVQFTLAAPRVTVVPPTTFVLLAREKGLPCS